jgi:hypothetical protein
MDLLSAQGTAVDANDVWMLDRSHSGGYFWHKCDGCEVLLAFGSAHTAASYTLTVTVLWTDPEHAPARGGATGAVLLVLFLLAATAVTVFVCRRRYTRGQALLPGFVKNPAAYLPSMPRFSGGGFTSFNSGRAGGRAQVGPTGPSHPVAGRRGTRMLDGAQELRSYDAPLVASEVGVPVGPRPGLVGSPLVGDTTPVRSTGTYTAPTPNGCSAALTPSSMGLFTPPAAGGNGERGAADVLVEPLRAGIASSTPAESHRV